MAQKKEETVAEKKLHEELISQLTSLSTAGFGLVAALAWNDTIQAFVKEYIQPHIPGSGILSKLIYAVFITALAVLITYQLSKIAARIQQRKN